MHTEPMEYIDDVRDQPIDCNAALSDEALATSGLVRVSAYVRTRSSANALRIKKARQRAAADGLRQLNVVVPIEAHAAIRAFVKDLQAGSGVVDAAKALLVGESAAGTPDVVVQLVDVKRAAVLERLAAQLAGLSGWRRWFARLAGLVW